jgi:hypothetical protein
MRYMGDPTSEIQTSFFQPGSSGLDAAARAQLLALAPSLPEDRAEFLAELNDATPYGKRQRWIRMGIGAACGVVLGLALGRVTSGFVVGRKKK